MHDVFHDHSPMWPEFNHGCPRPVPDDVEPYNTPYAVLGYTEAGEPVFTVHTVDGETYDVEAGGNIIVLKDTTYTLSSDAENIVLTASDGTTQSIPVFDSAIVTTTSPGFMSAADKVKLDGIQTGAEPNPGNATVSKAGLMSSSDKTKLNGIEEGAQVNPGLATTSSAGLMSSADKTKLDGLVPADYSDATTTTHGLMSAADKAKLDGVAVGAQVNTIEGIKLNGTAVAPDSNKIVNLVVSSGGGGSGDENVIEIVKVNGTALTPDANKAVNVTVPTKTSDITNDSNFVTTSEMNTAIANAIGSAMSASY